MFYVLLHVSYFSFSLYPSRFGPYQGRTLCKCLTIRLPLFFLKCRLYFWRDPYKKQALIPNFNYYCYCLARFDLSIFIFGSGALYMLNPISCRASVISLNSAVTQFTLWVWFLPRAMYTFLSVYLYSHSTKLLLLQYGERGRAVTNERR